MHPEKDLLLRNLGGTMPQIMERVADEMCPDLMAKFYPRVYENVGRYHSPRQCMAFLAGVVAETAITGLGNAPTANRLLLPALEPMAERKMPLFFITPDLLEAVLRTDFEGDIHWSEMHLPFEQGIFILPRGSFVHPDDGEVAMIVWGRFQKDHDYKSPLPNMPPIHVPNNAMCLVGLCMDKGIWYDSVLNANVRPTLRLNNMFYREPGDPYPKTQRTTALDHDLAPQDEPFLERLGVIAFGTLLAMNARPDLLVQDKLLHRVTKASKVREFWSPNIVGAHYHLQREMPRTAHGGTHASPRMHWRRGHFRQQAYGVGRKERKTIWLEPQLIGAQT